MEHRLADMADHLFSLDITVHLLGHDFVQQALVAAALLGLVAGLIGPFIVMRQMSFAVHGSSELSLTGAAFALLVGIGVGVGALIGSALAAALFGVLGRRARERDSVIGVVLAFGLGLAVLFIHLYPGRTATSFALLTGQIVGVGYTGLTMLALVCLLVIAVLASADSNRAAFDTRRAPTAAAVSSVRFWLHAMTSMPNAAANPAIRLPTRPRPSSPSVLPDNVIPAVRCQPPARICRCSSAR